MKNRIKIVSAIMHTTMFKVAIMGILFMSFYQTFYASQTLEFFEGFLHILKDPNYHVMFLMLGMFITTLTTYTMINRFTMYCQRLKDKYEFQRELIIHTIIVNTIVFIIAMLFLLAGLFLVNKRVFTTIMPPHSMYLGYYVYFFIIKMYIMFQCVGIINVCLLKVINEKIVIVGNVLFYVHIFNSPVRIQDTFDSLSKMPLLFGENLFPLRYTSFGLEVLCSSIYCVGLGVLAVIVYKMVSKIKCQIGE